MEGLYVLASPSPITAMAQTERSISTSRDSFGGQMQALSWQSHSGTRPWQYARLLAALDDSVLRVWNS